MMGEIILLDFGRDKSGGGKLKQEQWKKTLGILILFAKQAIFVERVVL